MIWTLPGVYNIERKKKKKTLEAVKKLSLERENVELLLGICIYRVKFFISPRLQFQPLTKLDRRETTQSCKTAGEVKTYAGERRKLRRGQRSVESINFARGYAKRGG